MHPTIDRFFNNFAFFLGEDKRLQIASPFPVGATLASGPPRSPEKNRRRNGGPPETNFHLGFTQSNANIFAGKNAFREFLKMGSQLEYKSHFFCFFDMIIKVHIF